MERVDDFSGQSKSRNPQNVKFDSTADRGSVFSYLWKGSPFLRRGERPTRGDPSTPSPARAFLAACGACTPIHNAQALREAVRAAFPALLSPARCPSPLPSSPTAVPARSPPCTPPPCGDWRSRIRTGTPA